MPPDRLDDESAEPALVRLREVSEIAKRTLEVGYRLRAKRPLEGFAHPIDRVGDLFFPRVEKDPQKRGCSGFGSGSCR
jgi:hypothetical protein